MSISQTDISAWFDKGVSAKKDYLIIVCDTFEWSDYPVFTTKDNFWEKFNTYSNNDNMQRIMEVYDLNKNKIKQLKEPKSFNIPPPRE